MLRRNLRLLIAAMLGAVAAHGFAPANIPVLTFASLSGLLYLTRHSRTAPTFWIVTAYAGTMWMVAPRWLPKAFEMMDPPVGTAGWLRSEEHTSALQSLMRISYAVFCLTKKTHHI